MTWGRATGADVGRVSGERDHKGPTLELPAPTDPAAELGGRCLTRGQAGDYVDGGASTSTPGNTAGSAGLDNRVTFGEGSSPS